MALPAQVAALGKPFARDLDLAGMGASTDRIGVVILGVAAMLWVLALVFIHPGLLIAALLLAGSGVGSFYGTKLYVKLRVKRRIGRFQNQLEGVLRMLSGAVRVGLGMRQALVHVAEQSEEPARSELMRVVGISNLGVSVLDAIDELGKRIPTAETQMLTRVIRVQATAGGDLAGVLEGLAGTIRDRRRLFRKVKALTAQGQATAYILGALPLFVGGFVLGTQPQMADATFNTTIGHIALGLGLGLNLTGMVVLMKLTKLDV
ncbi:MAG: type II secretion system F family protein [Candidatus Eremiobacteraeota bacterium]|nr:type II secretion system F family protein [Candidatus Eremiobacteraeota bacterium]